MARKQEYTWREAQDDLERIALPWAEEHATRPGNHIDVLPPDIESNPFQDVDEVVTWASAPPEFMPDQLASMKCDLALAKGLGGNILQGWLSAKQISEDLKRQPAFADQPTGPTIIEQTQDDMRNGINQVQAFPHQILPDLGVGILATLKATDDLSYITNHNFMPISPTMKFEKFAGKAIARRSKRITHQIWVFPQTPSADKKNIPRRLRARMGRKINDLISPILDDPKRGTISYTALLGSGMIPTIDKQTGRYTALDFPEVYDSAAGALTKTTRTLPFAVYKDPLSGRVSWNIGHFINREELEVDSETERNIKFMDEIMLDLTARMQKLARVPVKYTRPEMTAELLGPVPTIVNI